MTAKTPIGGLSAVFQTPFDDSGEVDVPALARQGDWLFENGADGMAFAMVSEVLRLSSEERDIVAEATCRICASRGTSVISVGAESTPQSAECSSNRRHTRSARA